MFVFRALGMMKYGLFSSSCRRGDRLNVLNLLVVAEDLDPNLPGAPINFEVQLPIVLGAAVLPCGELSAERDLCRSTAAS